jgi:hypothetical protein
MNEMNEMKIGMLMERSLTLYVYRSVDCTEALRRCDTGLLGHATIRARNALEQRRVVTRRRWNLRRLLSGKPCGHESCIGPRCWWILEDSESILIHCWWLRSSFDMFQFHA